MKKVLAAVAVACVSTGFTQTAEAVPDDDSRIYNAMPGYGVPIDYNGPKTTQKSIGGLRCRMFETAYGAGGTAYLVSYECKLSKKGRDDAAIYNTLSARAQREAASSPNDIVDVIIAGALKCWKKTNAETAGAPVYGCKLPRRWFF